ncbi:alcohol dehydrogenase [Marinomonas sp. SBI22]|uniref:SDR family NAD(P)-dependent oxidoreductase n=1 Tax=unclassified Marinomonas TaxID=196814 RepID=UPI0007AF5016|nr:MULTISPECIES: SDR family NAD(P)-dependent oxidoreductase [unclassified Marinomonas]KZM39266.1 alcohol dehydrogenase [Marinomonas sp. SBI22]KZM40187.1 alcohol dehydrogenase [Marinomonas sp. SBI8L]
MQTSQFKNKTILITGAGSGMGRQTALQLASEGAQLALIGRQLEPLATLSNELKKMGVDSLAITCDISIEESVILTIEKIKTHFGKLDGVFANAGILGDFKTLAETEKDDFITLFNTNLLGTFFTIKHSLSLMAQGSIVINASWTANAVMPGAGAYASTKGAILAMMKTLAIEQGPNNIRVNAINPGIILTPMAEEVLDQALSTRLAQQAALKRNGTPEDVAGTVAWLLSDNSPFVTGQEITIDGGYSIGGVRL